MLSLVILPILTRFRQHLCLLFSLKMVILPFRGHFAYFSPETKTSRLEYGNPSQFYIGGSVDPEWLVCYDKIHDRSKVNAKHKSNLICSRIKSNHAIIQ